MQLPKNSVCSSDKCAIYLDKHELNGRTLFFWARRRVSYGRHSKVSSVFRVKLNPNFEIWSKMICWVELSLCTISYVGKKTQCWQYRPCLKIVAQSVAYRKGPKSRIWNSSNHLLHILSESVPSPKTFNKAIYPCWNSYRIHMMMTTYIYVYIYMKRRGRTSEIIGKRNSSDSSIVS